MCTESLNVDLSVETRVLPFDKARSLFLLNFVVNAQQQLDAHGLCAPCFEGLAYVDPEGYFSLLSEPRVQTAPQETYFSGLRAITVALTVAPETTIPAFLSMTENHVGEEAVMAGAGVYIDWLLGQGKIDRVVEFVAKKNPWAHMDRVIDAVACDGSDQDKEKLTAVLDGAVKKRWPEERAHAYHLADRYAQINPQRALAWVRQAFDEAGTGIAVTYDGMKAVAENSVLLEHMKDVPFDNFDRPARLGAAESLLEGRLINRFSGSISELLLKGLKVNSKDIEKHATVIEAKARALATIPGAYDLLVNTKNTHVCSGLLQSIPMLVRQTTVDHPKIDRILTQATVMKLDTSLVSEVLSQSLPMLTLPALNHLKIHEYDFRQWLILAPALLDESVSLSVEDKHYVAEHYLNGLQQLVNTENAGVALSEIGRRFPESFEANYQQALKSQRDPEGISNALGTYVAWNPSQVRMHLEHALLSRSFAVQAGAMKALEHYYAHNPEWTLAVIETVLSQRNHVYVKEKAKQTLSAIVHNLVTELTTSIS